MHAAATTPRFYSSYQRDLRHAEAKRATAVFSNKHLPTDRPALSRLPAEPAGIPKPLRTTEGLSANFTSLAPVPGGRLGFPCHSAVVGTTHGKSGATGEL